MVLTLMLMMNSKQLSLARWNYDIDNRGVLSLILMAFDVEGQGGRRVRAQTVYNFPAFP